mgnify:FL=1
MAGLSNYAKEKILRQWFKNDAYLPANNFVTVAGFANDTDLVTNYQDNQCWDLGRNVVQFGSATDRYVLNNDVVLLTPTYGNEWMSHFGICDATLHGEILAFGEVDVAAMTIAGRDVRFGINTLGLMFEDYTAPGTGAISDYVANHTLNKLFVSPATTIPIPTKWYLGIHNERSQTDGEWIGPVYQRVEITWDTNVTFSGNFAQLSAIGSNLYFNDNHDSTLVQFGVYDAQYGGNLLAYVEPDPKKILRRYSNVVVDPSGLVVKV